MQWVAALAGSAVVALAPPPGTGLWHQLGSAITSRPGKAVRVFRGATLPHALGIVVTSRSPRPIHVFWSNYCEVNDDDTMEASQQDKATGVGTVYVYPPVIPGATRCYVFVTATVGAGATVTAAEFSF
jgi:hypothetical protein